MTDTPLYFYHSKIKLNIQIIFFFPFMIGFYYLLYMGVLERSLLVILMGLFFSILMSILWGTAVLKLIRNQPYIILTNTYLQLDPQTKSEMTIYYNQIEGIQMSESSFQRIIEVTIYDEKGFFDELSLHNKIRLGPNGIFGFKTFMITYNAVRKRERPQLLQALNNVMLAKENEVTEDFAITDTSIETLESKQDFVKKYDPQPIKKLNIDSTYFKKAYGYSFFIFPVMFVLFYLLLDSDNSYLTYIINNFFAFPFAKVLIDWMGFYKLRERLEKQKGSTYYFDQLKYLFDGLLFHASIYIAPFGGTFLLIRYVINKVRS